MTASTLYGRLSVKFDFELRTMPAQVLLTILLLSVLVPVTEDMLLKHVAEVAVSAPRELATMAPGRAASIQLTHTLHIFVT